MLNTNLEYYIFGNNYQRLYFHYFTDTDDAHDNNIS